MGFFRRMKLSSMPIISIIDDHEAFCSLIGTLKSHGQNVLGVNKEIEKLRKLPLDSLRKFQTEVLQSAAQADAYIENSEHPTYFSSFNLIWKEQTGFMIGWRKEFFMALPCEVMVRTGESLWIVYDVILGIS